MPVHARRRGQPLPLRARRALRASAAATPPSIRALRRPAQRRPRRPDRHLARRRPARRPRRSAASRARARPSVRERVAARRASGQAAARARALQRRDDRGRDPAPRWARAPGRAGRSRSGHASARLSGRGHDRVLRVARTIADLAGSATEVEAERRDRGARRCAGGRGRDEAPGLDRRLAARPATRRRSTGLCRSARPQRLLRTRRPRRCSRGLEPREPAVTIVGARRATAYGRGVAADARPRARRAGLVGDQRHGLRLSTPRRTAARSSRAARRSRCSPAGPTSPTRRATGRLHRRIARQRGRDLRASRRASRPAGGASRRATGSWRRSRR